MMRKTFNALAGHYRTVVLQRLQYAAFSVLGVVLITLAAIVMFGGTLVERAYGIQGLGDPSSEKWEHGWPLVFLSRSVAPGTSSRFMILDGELQFDLWYCLINTSLLAVGTIICFGYAKWRTARRPAATVSLAEVLVVMALLTVPMASFGLAISSSQREMSSGRLLEDLGYAVGYDYIGPLWLSRLLGSEDTELPLYGVTSLSVPEHLADAEANLHIQTIVQLKCITVLRLDGSALTDKGAATMLSHVSPGQLQELSLDRTKITGICFKELAPPLSALRVLSAVSSKLNDDGVCALGDIVQLREVHASESQITKIACECLDRFPRLGVFTAEFTSIRERDCKKLKNKGVVCLVD